MKIIFLILLLIAIDIYFYLGTASSIKSLFNSSVFELIYWFIAISSYVYIFYLTVFLAGTNSQHGTNNIVYQSLFFVFFFSKLTGCFPLIIDDIIRVFRFLANHINDSKEYDIKRLEFLKKSAVILSSTLLTSLLIGMKWGRYNFKKNYQDIFIKDWPSNLNNYKIVHISDLHLGSFNNIDKLNEVVNIINNEEPDLVVFTGDLVNNFYEEAVPYLDGLKKIKAKDGKFSVLGNHDYGDYAIRNRSSKEWKNNFNNLLNLEKEAGFDLLLNDSRLISKKQAKFNIVGVENWGAGRFNKDGDLNVAMNGVDDSLPTILLSHDPSHWKEVVLNSSYMIDLQLSGHTHGMQFGIEIPGFKWSPVKYRYEQWAGLYDKNQYQIYVNRGLGHLGYTGRVGIMPDISILNIFSKS
tara:strand:- start:344 stop:1570 length:1227 start_codon:yes stop_codon:yes gene_type:complete